MYGVYPYNLDETGTDIESERRQCPTWYQGLRRRHVSTLKDSYEEHFGGPKLPERNPQELKRDSRWGKCINFIYSLDL